MLELLDLDEIRERLRRAKNASEFGEPVNEVEAWASCGVDVPDLLAEVVRLRSELDAAMKVVRPAVAFTDACADEAGAADLFDATDALHAAVDEWRVSHA